MHPRHLRCALVIALLLAAPAGALAAQPGKLIILPPGSYQLVESTRLVLRLTDGALIPNSPRSRDWAEYQAWLKAGNTPLPAAAGKP